MGHQQTASAKWPRRISGRHAANVAGDATKL